MIIAGAGLAGACAALALGHRYRVLVLEAAVPGTGASGAAAGLVHGFPGRTARPAWRHAEALDALETVLVDAAAGSGAARPLLRRSGVLRPARDAAQAEAFRETARAHPAETDWLAPGAARERFPDVVAREGALWICRGGHARLPELVRALLAAAAARGASLHAGRALTRFAATAEGVRAETTTGPLAARFLVLAPGADLPALPGLPPLPLHAVKGQTVRLAPPETLGPLPAVAGGTYLVPEGDALVVGATFEHRFADRAPDPAASRRLHEAATRLVPALGRAVLLGARAGVRMTVPATHSPRRLPLLAPLPDRPRVWVFSGLGAKGLLLAPLLAAQLPDWLEAPARRWPELPALG
ncbi:MAG: NAD(P)/FAD-dependent oxidoreductase [Rubricoccaceae bacterium]